MKVKTCKKCGREIEKSKEICDHCNGKSKERIINSLKAGAVLIATIGSMTIKTFLKK